MREQMEILIVDDDEVTRQLLQEVLEREGFRTRTAESGEAAVVLIRKVTFPIIISDIRMLELDGLAVLREAKKRSPATAVILMTGFGSMEGAIEAVRAGAFDYVSKPFKLEQILAVTQRGIRHWESLANEALRRTARDSAARGAPQARELIGKSPRIVEVYKLMAHATLSPSCVLIRGESGTGKGMVARAIHDNGDRRSQPFVQYSGSLEAAIQKVAGGTLYLEEVSSLPPAEQAELLHLIEEDRFAARLIAATQVDLEEEVKKGNFREDLFYQLKVIAIELPPLRDRIEDLPALVDAFLVRYSQKNSKNVSHVAPEALDQLKRYSWPGNIRELGHAIERAVVMTNSSVLFPEDFSGLVRGSDVRAAGEQSLEEVEKSAILRVLAEVQYNKSRASEVLGIDRATLYRKAQRYGIDLRGK